MDTQILLIILPLFSALAIGLVFYFSYEARLSRFKVAHTYAAKTQQILTDELQQEKELNQGLNNDLRDLENTATRLHTELRAVNSRLIEELNNEEKQQRKFENIANKILREQSQVFANQQSQNLNQILDPLKQKIHQFEARVESTNKEAIARNSSLLENINLMRQYGDKISKDTNNLANALKGDYKKQGNWGELILKNILDKSGLEEGREYTIQDSERDEEGKLKRPDVVLSLPNNQRIVIDSKVSLSAYNAVMAAESEEESKSYAKSHALAIKQHIDGLSQKRYHDLYDMHTPDFVFMFIPIDTAFGVALQQQPNLYDYAFDKNIVIVTPSMLLATLKTVESMWRIDKQNRYAIEIANEAGRMYDKFVGLTESFSTIEKQLNTAQNSFQEAKKRLSTGTGNLVGRAERIKSLGAKASKALKSNLVEEAAM